MLKSFGVENIPSSFLVIAVFAALSGNTLTLSVPKLTPLSNEKPVVAIPVSFASIFTVTSLLVYIVPFVVNNYILEMLYDSPSRSPKVNSRFEAVVFGIENSTVFVPAAIGALYVFPS